MERADRRDRARRGVIAAGIGLLAVLLLIALVVIFKSASDDTPTSRADRGAGETGGVATEPLGPDSNVDPGAAGALPGPLPPASPTPEVPAAIPLAPAPVIAPAPPAAPAANGPVSNAPVQPIDPSGRPPAVSPAQFPPPTIASTREATLTQTESPRFFVNNVYPGPMTFAASGACAESRAPIFVTNPAGTSRQAGTLGNPETYPATSVGRHTVVLEGQDMRSCSVTVTYRTRA